MRRRTLIILAVLLILIALSLWMLADSAWAHGSYPSTEAFLAAEVLGPHQSVIHAHAMVDVWRWYGVDVLDQIVILGAETSLGDPRLGGRLVRESNFGCIRAFGNWQSTPWGAWANGTVTIRGKQWLTWPDPDTGLYAWGRYMKVGVHGRYPALLEANDWSAFARTYYGAGVPGLGQYTTNLYAIQAHYRALAARHGFSW